MVESGDRVSWIGRDAGYVYFGISSEQALKPLDG